MAKVETVKSVVLNLTTQEAEALQVVLRDLLSTVGFSREVVTQRHEDCLNSISDVMNKAKESNGGQF